MSTCTMADRFEAFRRLRRWYHECCGHSVLVTRPEPGLIVWRCSCGVSFGTTQGEADADVPARAWRTKRHKPKAARVVPMREWKR